MPDKIQNRRDTLSNWTSKNPVLTSGEIGYITDTNEFVIGNGTDTFSTLKRFRDESLLQEHIGSTDGHPTATQSANGFLSSTDKTKLDGVEANANNYTLESHDNTKHTVNYASQADFDAHNGSTTGHPIATTSANGFLSSTDKTKLDGVSSGATKVTSSAYPSGYNKLILDGVTKLMGGEVVEKGSNYLAFENGLLIVFLNQLFTNSTETSFYETINFPKNFIDTNYIVLFNPQIYSVDNLSDYTKGYVVMSKAVNSFVMKVTKANATEAYSIDWSFFIIGWWK